MGRSLRVILDRKEDRFGILIAGNGQQVAWPIEDLPEEVKVGEVLYLSLSDQENPTGQGEGALGTPKTMTEGVEDDQISIEEREQRKMAKIILEEILNEGSEEEEDGDLRAEENDSGKIPDQKKSQKTETKKTLSAT